jgi:hypothetical protein
MGERDNPVALHQRALGGIGIAGWQRSIEA